MPRDETSAALVRALALASLHPAVSNVGTPSRNEARALTSVDMTFQVSLPSEWQRAGKSPSEVKRQEVVRFDFPTEFPMAPPRLSLRPDFNRNLPHMQPWLAANCPVPCIYDGDLTELFHWQGLPGILNQTIDWLERAALGTLIDPEQGWEPVRRDSFQDTLVADADSLRHLVNRNGGYRFLGFRYLRAVVHGRATLVHGQVSPDTARINPKTVPDVFQEKLLRRNPRLYAGKSVALVVWPGKYPSGKPVINDTYLPETVADVSGLKVRAQLYGCRLEIEDALHWLRKCLARHQADGPFPLPVIILARRPYNIIGSQSPIELCPYVASICSPGLFANGDDTPVRPSSHHHGIARSLLVRMSGGDPISERPSWTLLGAGSLGSKLALHLARAGNGPAIVLDRSAMTPHNAARHALIPPAGDMQIHWMNAKATVLCESLCGLDQSATPIIADAIGAVTSASGARRVSPKRSWAIVNATASLAVREAFAATELIPTRVIETSLFAGGRVGVITVEGPDRNPNTSDLMAECYALLQDDPTLAPIVFGSSDAVSRQNIGQGCGSLTMTMSDGRLSLFAAGMAEYLLRRQRDGLPLDAGEILIGRLMDDQLGLNWRIIQVPPAVVVASRMNGETWRVRVHGRAVTQIQEETARWPDAETGGVLMGRLSGASRTVHVIDALDPPEDSVRSASEFILGTTGVRQRVREYSDAVDWSLYCLGTWHSHLAPSGPSALGRLTAEAVFLGTSYTVGVSDTYAHSPPRISRRCCRPSSGDD